MLKNLFKRKEKTPVMNETFGEVVETILGWSKKTDEKIILWGKEYEIEVTIVTLKNEYINVEQEHAYKNFKMTREEKQKQTEDIIERYFGTTDKEVLIEKFTPTELMFGKFGECVLLADNADDDEEMHDVPEGLALCFEPLFKLYTQEESISYIVSKDGMPTKDIDFIGLLK